MNTVHIHTIHELHSIMEMEPPKHPLISVIDASTLSLSSDQLDTKIILDFYMISLKDKSCGIEYGRNTFDFEEGVMVFSAPGQVYTATSAFQKGEIIGWLLYVHPDLFRGHELGNRIHDFSLFNYDVYEALHLSIDEENPINQTVKNIENEYSQRIDKHSQPVLISNLELLLNYSERFYDRQFNTRSNKSKGVVADFESALKQYFQQEKHLETGLPSIEYFSNRAALSQHYFSDLIKKETERSPKDHINDFVIEKAKNMLMSGN